MHAIDWHVIRELLALRAHFDQVFERAVLPSSSAPVSPVGSFEPPADVWESDDRLVVEVELPGARASDLEVRIEDNVLIVCGNVSAPSEERENYLRVERPRGRFLRRLPLPSAVEGPPEASLKGGVLSVTIRKSAARRRIPVEPGGQ